MEQQYAPRLQAAEPRAGDQQFSGVQADPAMLQFREVPRGEAAGPRYKATADLARKEAQVGVPLLLHRLRAGAVQQFPGVPPRAVVRLYGAATARAEIPLRYPGARVKKALQQYPEAAADPVHLP